MRVTEKRFLAALAVLAVGWFGLGSVATLAAQPEAPAAQHEMHEGTLANQVPPLTPEQQKNPHLAIPGGQEAVAHKREQLEELSQEEKAQFARVDEKPGAIIPQGIMFRDETGREVAIGSLMDVPVILVPVYYSCPGTCHLLLSSLARILPGVALVPGKEYRVIAVSFDEHDTPELAMQRKNNMMAAMDFAYPPEGWVFLSGSKESVAQLMGSFGFRYKRMGKDFIHPTMLLAVAPGGKISRYLYGQSFMPFDITMSLNEAAQGKVSLSLKRVLAYCFTYDAASKRFVFDFMRLAGVVILFGAGVFLFVLVKGNKRKKRP
ncbi:SCO family protein [Desulfovibrio cuneatus]|uniref:SCO family protein n=1 Tax=Desulfovibrio cuneatus TaxID=159728 RepID=UPI0004002B73|nr:SCO family protein [Desulfovibrio cuneatus]